MKEVVDKAIDPYIPESKLYPVLEEKIKELIKLAKQSNMIVDVFHGFRSFSEQEKLYAKGRTRPGPKVTEREPSMATSALTPNRLLPTLPSPAFWTQSTP